MDKIKDEMKSDEVKKAARYTMTVIQQESEKLEKVAGIPSPFFACALSSIVFESTLRAALHSGMPTGIHEKAIALVIQLLKKAS